MRLFKISMIVLSLVISSIAKDGVVDIDEMVKKEAAVENKHIIVFFHMTFCPYCIKMKKNGFSDQSVKRKIDQDYIFVDINVDDEGVVKYKDFQGGKKEFAKSLSIAYYPSVVFIDKNNEIVYTIKGYKKKKTFNHTLDYVTSRAYLRSDFAGYLFDIDAE